jgi:NADPH:quinone reductase-like Zn-dependent oxidoreductase
MFAERSVVSRTWCLPIPDGVDDVTAAALPNPALSSWLPLAWPQVCYYPVADCEAECFLDDDVA